MPLNGRLREQDGTVRVFFDMRPKEADPAEGGGGDRWWPTRRNATPDWRRNAADGQRRGWVNKMGIVAGCAVIAGGVALSAGNANATDTTWWVLDAGSSACLLAKALATARQIPSVASPALFEAELRMEGGYKSTRIFRDHDGNIAAVLITGGEAGAHDLTVSYFPGKGPCEVSRQVLVKDGALANPNELR